MSKLVWDQQGEKRFEAGVDRGVLFVYNKTTKAYGTGVAWNGLTSVEESPSGAEANKYYADNQVYANITSKEEYGCTIGAYMYPDEFNSCNGVKEIAPGATIGQQSRDTFAFAYRSNIGTDMDQNAGYIIHLIYGCKASPSSKSHQTIGENIEPGELSWEVTTTPVQMDGFEPTATVEVNSLTTDAAKLAAFEDIIYGTAANEPRIPMPDEVARLLGTTNSNSGNSGNGGSGAQG